jgi:putative transposase
MCTWLSVSASGFFDWRRRPDSATARRRERLAALIRAAFETSDETYGYRRIHAQLARWGVPCGPELVRGIMRELGLQPCQPRPWRAGLTEQDGRAHHIPDLVARDFTAERPGQKFVGDITYISTWEGCLYLATVIDCHTKMVVGYAMDDNYKTPLIVEALTRAADSTTLVPDAIFHSDRGSNYCSHEFAATITEAGMRQSVGRTGICYDNAMAESFFAALKNDRIHLHSVPDTRARTRRHCSLHRVLVQQEPAPLWVGLQISPGSLQRVDARPASGIARNNSIGPRISGLIRSPPWPRRRPGSRCTPTTTSTPRRAATTCSPPPSTSPPPSP